MKNECAWVLQAPGHIWNNNVGADAEILPLCLYRQGQGYGMIGAVQLENAIDLHAGSSLRVDSTGHPRRCECDFGVALAFQDFLMHFVVATCVSAVTASRVDHYKATGRAG